MTNGTYHAAVSATMVSVTIHSQKSLELLFAVQTVSFKVFSTKIAPPPRVKKKNKNPADTPQTRWCFSKSHSSTFVSSPLRDQRKI